MSARPGRSPVLALLPREHGGWGILLVPFFTAVVILGRAPLPVWLVLVALVLAFLARRPFELAFVPESRGRPPGVSLGQMRRYAWLYAAAAAALGSALVMVWKLTSLLPIGLLALSVFGLHLHLLRRRVDRGLPAQLLGTSALTLTGLAGWIAATGGLSMTGFGVWLLNWAYFCCGVAYVRSRIRGSLGAGRSSLTESPGFALTLHLVTLAFVLVLASARWTPPLVI
ncbi:MAG: YwiC-like family protein, partial [Terriglobia bacterium]